MNEASHHVDPLLLSRLGRGDWKVERAAMEPTRYRTELGAALRYTIVAREASRGKARTLRSYLKVYRRGRGPETVRVLRSLPLDGRAGRRPYTAVRPVAYLESLGTLVFEEAPGTSLTQSLNDGADPQESMRTVARAVAAFNQDDIRLPRTETFASQLDDLRLASRLARWAVPDRRETVDAIMATVQEGLEDVPAKAIHADLKPDHVFIAGDRVAFIDLDSAVMGDPVRDPAHLTAYLTGRVGLRDVSPKSVDAASAAFTEEYFRHVPASWRRRFPLHYAGALLEVASGIFRHQEPMWRRRAAKVIDTAQAVLRERAP